MTASKTYETPISDPTINRPKVRGEGWAGHIEADPELTNQYSSQVRNIISEHGKPFKLSMRGGTVRPFTGCTIQDPGEHGERLVVTRDEFTGALSTVLERFDYRGGKNVHMADQEEFEYVPDSGMFIIKGPRQKLEYDNNAALEALHIERNQPEEVLDQFEEHIERIAALAERFDTKKAKLKAFGEKVLLALRFHRQ